MSLGLLLVRALLNSSVSCLMVHLMRLVSRDSLTRLDIPFRRLSAVHVGYRLPCIHHVKCTYSLR